MKNSRWMKWPLAIVIGLAITGYRSELKQNSSLVGKNPLVGKWKYMKIAPFEGEIVDMNDPRSKTLHETSLGLMYHFTKDETFTVSRVKSTGLVVEIKRSKYKLSDDREYIILHGPAGPIGELYIVSLTRDFLNVNFPHASPGYLVFKKVP